jgi:hypothetical protein
MKYTLMLLEKPLVLIVSGIPDHLVYPSCSKKWSLARLDRSMFVFFFGVEVESCAKTEKTKKVQMERDKNFFIINFM